MDRKEARITKIRRTYSNSKTYHIIIKGIDNQDIFYDDQDRRVFLKKLVLTKKEYDNRIYAYCLMDNHVHLVIKIEKEFISKAMQTLMIRYVSYFNRKYDRTGTLVQNRFKSKNIENQRYFLEVCRYVHRNPENAKIAKTEEYKWSSYHEYLEKGKIVEKDFLLQFFNNDIKEFIKFTKKYDDYENLKEFAEYEIINKLKDEEVLKIIMKMFDISSVSEVATFFKKRKKEERQKYILKLKLIKGTNKTQVARIIRVYRKTIGKIWDGK